MKDASKWLVAITWILMMGGVATSETKLGVEGTRFTINGEPTFLLGISFYGALGASKEFILKDLDDMQRYGFNWIRVWATWSAFGNDVSAVDPNGNPREPYLGKLRWLIEECDRRGMVVDVTLSRGNGITGPPRLQNLESLSRAVRTLLEELKPYRNWYLDMANERNIRDKRYVPFEELVELRKLAKKLDPDRLITASYSGDIDEDDLRRYLLEVKVDFISPHRPRNDRSPSQTADRTRGYIKLMKEIGRVVPVHYQEPFRRGFRPNRWEPKAEDFLRDLKGAKDGGAAGWCFHNGDQKNRPEGKPRRSFDMREKRLFEQLDGEEMRFLKQMSKMFR